MYGIEEVKFNSVNKYDTICNACLSSDRVLSSLGEYMDIFQKSCDISQTTLISQVYICWECMAVLKRIKHFRARVQEAQRILQCHHVGDQISIPNSLSTLSKTICNNAIFVTHQEIKELEVKQEADTLDNSDSLAEHIDNDFTYLDDIKEEKFELKPDKKKYLKPKSSVHYRIIFESQKGTLKKKITVKDSEIRIWLERDRNSDVYRSFKYKCKKCVYGWNQKEPLSVHNKKYHEKAIGPYTCDICSSRFASKPRLAVHVSRHYSGYECLRCGYTCYTSRLIARHLHTHKRTVQCVYCEASFQSLAEFLKHYKSTHAVFLCDHCGKSCKSKHMLERHMTRHFETYECSICDRRYKTQATLRKHCEMKHVTACTEEAYCAPCDKQFNNAHMYRRHVQTGAAHAHERDAARIKKKVPCPDCGNVYSRKTYMMNHYRHVHMKQSKYFCGHCDRVTLSQPNPIRRPHEVSPRGCKEREEQTLQHLRQGVRCEPHPRQPHPHPFGRAPVRVRVLWRQVHTETRDAVPRQVHTLEEQAAYLLATMNLFPHICQCLDAESILYIHK